MAESCTPIENAVERGLEYLHKLLLEKPWAFSVVDYSQDRESFEHEYKSVYKGELETFTHYLALDVLHKFLPSSFKEQLIQKLSSTLSEELLPLYYFVSCRRFSEDVDTTAVGYTALLKANVLRKSDVLPVAEKIFSNINPDGVVTVLFHADLERRKDIVDACVCVNALNFAYALGQEHKMNRTEAYVLEWLESGNWKRGTVFYRAGITFLYFCSVSVKTNYRAQKIFKKLVSEALRSCTCSLKFPLDFSFWLLAWKNLGETVDNIAQIKVLMEMQENDGGWRPDAAWAPRDNIFHGGKALSTIFAVAALASQL